jgi:aryl-alcohol dehydrogenase-like predicted oxidoreductase
VEKRRFGNTDMDVSVLGFGGSEIGYEGASQETVNQILNDALDAGLNVIDTAECYPNSEAMIGKAVGNRRDDFFLFTKCGHPSGMGSEDYSHDGILASIERSLKRLQTEQVDLVLLHSCGEDVLRKAEAIEALQEAKQRGYTRYIGYSGDSLAAKYAIDTDVFDALETSVNIADQEAIELTLPLAEAQNLGVIVKRPIANAAWRTGEKPANPYLHVYWQRLLKLEYPFIAEDMATSLGTALRFTSSLPGVHTMIVGTTKPGRWHENAALLASGTLSRQKIDEIRERWHMIANDNWVGQT